MRYHCYFCGKSVTTELPDDSVIRAVLVCPECIEAKRILLPEDAEERRA
jgi:DNA-directed RNA polymerase subunit RPC12/RpoP